MFTRFAYEFCCSAGILRESMAFSIDTPKDSITFLMSITIRFVSVSHIFYDFTHTRHHQIVCSFAFFHQFFNNESREVQGVTKGGYPRGYQIRRCQKLLSYAVFRCWLTSSPYLVDVKGGKVMTQIR